ncbi:MAG: carbohydrate ABC transporter permease [Saccharofermentanales bacterium]
MKRADRNIKTSRIISNLWNSRQSYILLAPFMTLFLFLTIIPILSAISLSFTDFNMLETPGFVAWQNYKRMILDDVVFFKVVKNTLLFAAITGPLGYVMSFLFAWLINETGRVMRTILTFVFYLPVLAGNIYFVWSFLLSGDNYGVINGFLLKWNVISEPVGFLTDPNYMLISVIIVQLWMSLGTGFLAFIAGLQGVNTSLYEVGAIDGIKNRWQELQYITLPSMAHQLLFGAVMQIGASFGISGIIVFLIGFPTSQYSADTIVTYIQDIGTTRFEMGYASTLAVFLFILMLLTNRVISGALRKYASI